MQRLLMRRARPVGGSMRKLLLLLVVLSAAGAATGCARPLPDLVPLELASLDLVEQDGDERLYNLLFRDPEGREVQAYLRTPRVGQRSAEPPYPAIVLAAGRYAGRQAAAVIPGPLEQVILAIEYPADIPPRLSAIAWMRRLPAFRRGAGHYVAALPEVDRQRLTLVGVSFGVPFAAAAGRDRVFTGVALHFGGADLAGMLRANLPIENGVLRGAFAEFGAWIFRDLEPAKHVGHISPTPLLLINGSADEQIPVSSALLLAERATPPVRHIWLDSGHLSSRDRHLLRELADSTFQHFEHRVRSAAAAVAELEAS
jgi:hypothetical protein